MTRGTRPGTLREFFASLWLSLPAILTVNSATAIASWCSFGLAWTQLWFLTPVALFILVAPLIGWAAVVARQIAVERPCSVTDALAQFRAGVSIGYVLGWPPALTLVCVTWTNAVTLPPMIQSVATLAGLILCIALFVLISPALHVRTTTAIRGLGVWRAAAALVVRRPSAALLCCGYALTTVILIVTVGSGLVLVLAVPVIAAILESWTTVGATDVAATASPRHSHTHTHAK